ncbi:MAG: hypothetical protein HYR60_04025 [Acidobacteria bacterium]|nr:hypothetical protein [Acidobacteriota bacterium]
MNPVKLAALLLLFWTAVAAGPAEKPAEIKPRLPALASVFPQGWQPGSKVRVEALGQYLDRADSVVFLDASIHGRVLEGSHSRLALEFEIEPGAALGPHYFRVVSPRGASNILLFRVGDQPHLLEKEPNSTLDDAQTVALPVTINGQLPVDGDFDFFRFHAGQGQTWIFDLRAARNGSGLDAALILLDARGRKLAHSEENFIWDPFLAYTFGASGDYVAVIQPTHVRNDPTFAYQLDIRTAPHLDTLHPISLRPGATAEATLFGAGLTGGPARLWFDAPGFTGEVLELRGSTGRVRIHAPTAAVDGEHALALITAGGRSNPAAFLVDSTPVHAGGDRIAPPVSINGIARYRQPERWSFDVQEGQKLLFEVRAQRFGSPVDSVLRILDDKGKQVAVNDDGNFPGAQFNKDSQILHTFAKAGRYQIEIRNLYKVTGEDYPYQLLVRAPQPAAELMLAADNPYVYPNGEGKLKVTAVRKEGHEGPIPIRVAGLPEGVSAGPVEIPAGKNDAEILFRAGDMKAGTHVQIRVEPVSGLPAWRSVRIASGGGEGATFAKVTEATLAVAEQPHFSLEAAVTNLNLVRGGSAEFEVSIQRAESFDGAIRFSFENLPRGVTAAETVAPAGAGRVKLRLEAAGTAAPGRAPRIIILGKAETGEVQEAPRIGLVID